jgi:hypothetical protein
MNAKPRGRPRKSKTILEA